MPPNLRPRKRSLWHQNVKILVVFLGWDIGFLPSRFISCSLDFHQPQPPSLGKENSVPLPPPLPPPYLPTLLPTYPMYRYTPSPCKKSDTNNLWGVGRGLSESLFWLSTNRPSSQLIRGTQVLRSNRDISDENAPKII